MTEHHHRRAVRFFWILVIAAAAVSITSNIAHAVWRFMPVVAVQIGTAAVPPLLLLAVVHGIGLSVRAGASGRVYRCALTATTIIGAGAAVLSFRSQRDLLIQTGMTPTWAWLWPVIVDIAIGVGTMMLVALGDRPTDTKTVDESLASELIAVDVATNGDSDDHNLVASTNGHGQIPDLALDEGLASALAVQPGGTRQSPETVQAVLAAWRAGASPNTAAKVVGVNYRTAKRIIEGSHLSPTGE
jgi:Protein of unknown function (DUF2637)